MAQESQEYYCRSWLVDDGLPHNVVARVIQDHQGYLWVGTATGLARFDGIHFKEFSDSAAAQRNRNNSVRDFFEESPGDLTVLARNGWILRYKAGLYSLHPISRQRKGLSFGRIFLTGPGVLWGTQNARLLRCENGKVEEFGEGAGIRAASEEQSVAQDSRGETWIAAGSFLARYKEGRLLPHALPSARPMTIGSSRSGGIWICTEESFGRLEDGAIHTLATQPPWMDSLVSVRSIFEDSEGAVWVGTSRRGLFRYADGKLISVPIPYRSIRSIMEDREGNIWVATDGFGLLRLRKKGVQLFNAQKGLDENISSSVCEDDSGDIWLANRVGHVVRIKEGVPTIFSFSINGQGVYAHTISADHLGRLWFGGPDGLYRVSLKDLENPRQIAPSMRGVRTMLITRANVVWVGLHEPKFGYIQDDEFHEIQAPARSQLGRVQAITEDRDGRIWLGGATGVLLSYHKGQFQRFSSGEGLPRNGINSLYADTSGNLWICSDGGLVLKQGNRFFAFSAPNLLPDHLLGQVIEDNKGNLWLSSRRGLFTARKDDLLAYAEGRLKAFHVRTVNKDEGVIGISPVTGFQPSIWKAHDGKIWFATLNGALALDPSLIPFNDQAPPVFISDVLLDDKELGTPTQLQIPYGQHRIEFRFSALSYAAPEKVGLRYQLEGLDPSWVNAESTRTASYPSLAPGHYRLRVVACNDNGIWNEEGASLDIVIIPAWWQTIWARGGVILLCMISLALLVRYWSHRKLRMRLMRLERENALNLERARIARDLHDELGGSLTQISLLAERIHNQREPAESQRLLPLLSTHTRRLTAELASIVWTISPQNNSLSQLASFIQRYALRLYRDTSIVCTSSGIEGIPALTLSPAQQHHLLSIAKEALNNSLKHSKASALEIRTSYAAGLFTMEFKDNGGGFDPESREAQEGNGIHHMRTRIAEIGGQIEIRSSKGQGTLLIVRFPCSTTQAPES